MDKTEILDIIREEIKYNLEVDAELAGDQLTIDIIFRNEVISQIDIPSEEIYELLKKEHSRSLTDKWSKL